MKVIELRCPYGQLPMLEDPNDRLLIILKAVADNSHAVIGAKDLDGRYLYVNSEYSRLFHLEQSEFIGKCDADFCPQEIADKFRQADLLVQSVGEVISVEEEVLLDGEIHHFLSVKFPIRDDNGKMYATGIVATNITKLKVLETELRHLTAIDPLTGVNNRRYLYEVAQPEIARSHRHEQPLSVILLDIDRFKQINDSFGHSSGDLVLQSIAKLIPQLLRNYDIFARLGGEEFAIVLPHTSVSNAVQIAERIKQQLAKLTINTDDGRQIRVTASMGIAQINPQLTDLDRILTAADEAMYRAKNEGRNCIRVY